MHRKVTSTTTVIINLMQAQCETKGTEFKILNFVRSYIGVDSPKFTLYTVHGNLLTCNYTYSLVCILLRARFSFLRQRYICENFLVLI